MDRYFHKVGKDIIKAGNLVCDAVEPLMNL